jgi:hypothetical protein
MTRTARPDDQFRTILTLNAFDPHASAPLDDSLDRLVKRRLRNSGES